MFRKEGEGLGMFQQLGTIPPLGQAYAMAAR
jgi:hypothetical protein